MINSRGGHPFTLYVDDIQEWDLLYYLLKLVVLCVDFCITLPYSENGGHTLVTTSMVPTVGNNWFLNMNISITNRNHVSKAAED